MQHDIKVEIKRLALRAIYRAERRLEKKEDYQSRFAKRTGHRAALSVVKKPIVHRHFDPKYCRRNANFLAKTIWKKVLDQTYHPSPAVEFSIKKPGGGDRRLMAFSIPDAALANVLLRRIRGRNLKKFSPQSYAYHPDKNLFDAVLDMRGFIVPAEKIYSVQVDFKDFFESIPHGYLKSLLNSADLINTSVVERVAIERFMRHKYAKEADYASGSFTIRRRGTPQGSSISLILANLALHNLDRELEKTPSKFVRFADDVVALTTNYQAAVDIENHFYQFSKENGLTINRNKSPGINVLSSTEQEIRTISSLDYLGYCFTESGLTLGEKSKARIKRKISKLINLYLIEYIRDFGVNAYRYGRDFDWDLLGLITELRRYMYGGLAEKDIAEMLLEGRRLKRVSGLMGFYCLLDDHKCLAELDGWLVNAVRRAMVERNKIIFAKMGSSSVHPSNRELILGQWMSPAKWRGPKKPDFRIPSFRRGARAARKYYNIYGIKDVSPPKYHYS